MAVDIGPKIGIDGESEFRKGIQNINQSIKTLQSEMKAVTSEFADNASAEQKLIAQNETLTKTIDAQEKKLALLQDGLQKSAQTYGENDTKTLKWQQAVNEATAALNKSKAALEQNEQQMRELGNETEETAKETSRLGDVFKGSLLSDLVMRGIDMLADGIRKIGGFMKDAVVDSAQFADDIITMSKVTGIGTDKLQEMSYMADLVDVSVETVTGSMRRLSKNMLSAEDGTGSAAEAFKTLGVEVTDSAGNLRDNEDVFAEIIDALGNMDDETRRDATAMQLFGKSATDLNPLIAAGGDAIKDYTREAHEMGYVLDTETLNSLGAVQDGFDRFKALGTAVKNQIGAALAPTIEKLTKKLTDLVKRVDWDKLVNGLLGIVDFAVDFAKVAAPMAAAFGAFKIAQNAAGWVQKLGASLTNTLMNPLGLAITAIGVFTTVFTTFNRALNDTAMGRAAREARELADSYERLKESQQQMVESTNAEYDYTQQLADELMSIVDANGKVNEGYEARAQFIVNELSKALGIEIEMVDGVIQGYDELSASIDNLIAKKRAEALVEADEPAYREAIAHLQEYTTAVEESEQRIIEKQAALDAVLTGSYSNPGVIRARQQALNEEIAYHDNMVKLRDGSILDIQNFETNYEHLLSGEYEMVTGYHALEQAAYVSNQDTIVGILEAGKEKIGAAAVGVVEDAGQRTQEAVVTAGFDKAGEYGAQGFANGLGSYTAVRAVITAASAIARRAMEALRAGLDEHSPSRAMMEIGELATEGFAIGLTNGLSSVRAAMTKTVNTVQEGMAGAVPTPQPTTASLVVGAVNGMASAAPAAGGGMLTVNLVMPDGKKLAQSTIKDFINVARANGTPITAY